MTATTLQQLLLAPDRTAMPLGTRQAVAKYSLILSDTLAFLLAALLASTLHWLRPEIEATAVSALWQSDMAQIRLQLLLPIFLLAIAWFWLSGHYTRRRPFWAELGEVLRILLMLVALDATLQYMAKLPFSRFWFIGVWLGALILLPLLRILTKGLLLRFGIWQRPAVVLGTGPNAVDAAEALHSEHLMGYQVIAFATRAPLPPSERHVMRAAGRDIPVVRFHPARPASLHGSDSPTIVVALEQDEFEREANFIARLHRLCGDLHVVPPLRGLPLFGSRVHYYFRHELFFLSLSNNLARRGPRLIKRSFDLLVASLLLLLLLPLFAYLAVKIRTDGGPVFFAHRRIGQQGRTFGCLKFRTMVPDAKQVLERLLKNDPAARAEWARDFKLKDDPRITPIGAFLRKTSLDELPQLWNVLKGEMSLVGPRPIVEDELDRYGEDIEYYLETKPGMTGLWQISGRNDTGYRERVYLDAWYAKNWSLWMDAVILITTVRVVLRNDGAY